MKKLFAGLFGALMGGSSLVAQSVTVLPPETFQTQYTAVQQPQLIDVRTPGEWQQGHLEGATRANVQSKEFDKVVATLDPERPVFVYCRSGGRSNMAARRLANKGFTQIYDLQGGISAWVRQGKKVVQN